MNRWSRRKQDAVIVMAIIVVLLALWRLHSPPKRWGGIGLWASTNVFGSATLSLLFGSRHGGNAQHTEGGTAAGESSTNLLGSTSVVLRASEAASNAPAAAENPTPVNQTPAAHLLNTNGPVTVIGVMPLDLEETNPAPSTSRVTSVQTFSEASRMERRLGEVSAKGGDIQISLFWRNQNDLDLHCIEPDGDEIFFSHKRSRQGGELDIDQNAQMPYNSVPVENIYWARGTAPPGRYRISVVYYAQHDPVDLTAFTVRTVVQGRTNFFSSAINAESAQQPKPICEFQYEPSNPDPARRLQFGQ